MSETFVLTTPLKVGEEELTELTLREPTPKDVVALGLPYRLNQDLTAEPIPAVCLKYIAKLAAIPPSAVERLDLNDFTMLLYMVVAFFNRSHSESQAS